MTPVLFDYADWMARQRLQPKQFRPKPGFVRNPLLKKGRNEPCLCGSEKKWKVCCGPTMPLYIPVEDVADHEAALRGEI